MLTLIVAAVTFPVGQQLPEDLQIAQNNRKNLFKTAYIEWSYHTYDGKQHGAVVRRYVTRYFPNGDISQIHLPIEYQYETPLEATSHGRYANTTYLRQAQGHSWKYTQGANQAEAMLREKATLMHTYDLLRLGFTYSQPTWGPPKVLSPDDYITEYVGTSLDRASWQHEVLENGNVVWYTPDGGGRKNYAFVVSPADGGNLVEMRTPYNSPSETKSCKVEYSSFEKGIRFPARAEFQHESFGDAVILIDYAEFDRPAHPQEANIAEVLGVPVGITVDTRNMGLEPMQWRGRLDENGVVFAGDETYKSIDIEAVDALVQTMKSDYRTPQKDEKGYWFSPRLAREPRLWENYTRSFITVNRLSRDQATEAWKILRDNQKRAFAYLESVDDNLKDLVADRKEATIALNGRESADYSKEEAKQELKRLDIREQKLLERIVRIFAEKLRPDLYGLLTPSQLQREATRRFIRFSPEQLEAEKAAALRRR